MKSIFISHPQTETYLIELLGHELIARGFVVSGAHNIEPGENWQSAILSGIKRSHAVIAYLGPDEPNPNVMLEIGYAIGAGKKIVLIADGPSRIPLDIASLPVFTSDKPMSISPTATHRLIDEVVEYVGGLTPDDRITEQPQGSAREVLAHVVDDPSILERIAPREFEELIARFFSELGFDVELTAQNRDGGFDIVLNGVFGHRMVVVETRRYTPQARLGVNEVQRLVGAAVVARATCAILVTTGSFTRSAIDFASQAPINVELYTIEELLSVAPESITHR